MSQLATNARNALKQEQDMARDAGRQELQAAYELRIELRRLEGLPETRMVMDWLRYHKTCLSLMPVEHSTGYFHCSPHGQFFGLESASLSQRLRDWAQNVQHYWLELTPAGIRMSRFDGFNRVYPAERLSMPQLTQLLRLGGSSESVRKEIFALAEAIAGGTAKPTGNPRLWSTDHRAGFFGLVGKAPSGGCWD